jgi:hypothetical protein
MKFAKELERDAVPGALRAIDAVIFYPLLTDISLQNGESSTSTTRPARNMSRASPEPSTGPAALLSA